MVTRFRTSAKAITLAALSFPQIAAAQSFTGADVLGWPEESQNSFFQTSVTMVGIVASQVEGHEHIAECIDNWYGGGEASLPQRVGRIREVMQAMPEYHPQIIILAVIEDACGEF